MQYKNCMAADVAGYVACWQPVSVPPQAARFARSVVERAAPPTRARANALLWAAARCAGFAIPLGLEPVTPYSPAEIDGYLALADAQPTVLRRMRAAGLVCLGAGAGLTGADLRGVRGSDVACRSGGVVVDVHGARPRAVPVLSRYHDILLASAEFAGSGLVTGGTSAVRKNITTPLIRSLAGGTGLPRLEASRLRATWLADCARLLGLATFMHAAGITCSQRLGDLLTTLGPADEATAVALLGATR